VKPNINSVEVHPQVSNNGHPVEGALVGAGSLCPFLPGPIFWVLGSLPNRPASPWFFKTSQLVE